MKIEIEVSEKNEGTSAPWWVIIDPRQNFEVKEQGLYNIASMITGPYFSREEAENWLKCTRYNYGPNAHVFCLSGYGSGQYENKVKF